MEIGAWRYWKQRAWGCLWVFPSDKKSPEMTFYEIRYKLELVDDEGTHRLRRGRCCWSCSRRVVLGRGTSRRGRRGLGKKGSGLFCPLVSLLKVRQFGFFFLPVTSENAWTVWCYFWKDPSFHVRSLLFHSLFVGLKNQSHFWSEKHAIRYVPYFVLATRTNWMERELRAHFAMPPDDLPANSKLSE